MREEALSMEHPKSIYEGLEKDLVSYEQTYIRLLFLLDGSLDNLVKSLAKYPVGGFIFGSKSLLLLVEVKVREEECLFAIYKDILSSCNNFKLLGFHTFIQEEGMTGVEQVKVVFKDNKVSDTKNVIEFVEKVLWKVVLCFRRDFKDSFKKSCNHQLKVDFERSYLEELLLNTSLMDVEILEEVYSNKLETDVSQGLAEMFLIH